MNIVDHLEAHLGAIDGGWGPTEGSSQIQVVRFNSQPFEGAVTYSTLGMSRTVLPLSDVKQVRQELLFTAYERFPPEQIASFLLTFCEYVLSKNRALLRGDVVGPSTPLISGVAVNAVYAALPVVFSDGLATFAGSTPATVLVWLLPILGNEAAFIKSSGWGKFEDLLEARDPDLWDLNRPSLV